MFAQDQDYNNELIPVEGYFLHRGETPRAYLFAEDKYSDMPIHLPKSQVHDLDIWGEGPQVSKVTFSLPRWLAEREGLC